MNKTKVITPKNLSDNVKYKYVTITFFFCDKLPESL